MPFCRGNDQLLSLERTAGRREDTAQHRISTVPFIADYRDPAPASVTTR